MNWKLDSTCIQIIPPKEFDFQECLVFLNRSNQELLHQMKDGHIYKLLKIDESLILVKLGYENHMIKVEFPYHQPSEESCRKVAEYVWKWFDLDSDLAGFYEMATKDKVLNKMAQQYYGLRILCIPDLFEALIWAIIGQQINLTFAYTLKRRLIEHFGESLTVNGDTFWLFPSYKKIASIDLEDLKKLQFTGRKAEYIIGIANSMKNGEITKESLLLQQDNQKIVKSLTAIRGIGPWSADYVMMKCFHSITSFPIGDVGLQNALKICLGMERKPTVEEMKKLAENWEGWEAYATFYLWRSLYE